MTLSEKGVRDELALCGLLLVFSVLIALADRVGLMSPVYSAYRWVYMPVSYWSTQTVDSSSKFFKQMTRLGSLRDDNFRLQKRIVELEVENTKLKEIEIEKNRLSEQCSVVDSFEYSHLIEGRAVAKDVNGEPGMFLIDKGGKHGVSKDDAIVVRDVLVGVVDQVSEGSALVMGVSSFESRISAATVREDRAHGIVGGSLDGVVFSEVLDSEPVDVGDQVVTWGGELPTGLYLGTVRSISGKPAESTKSAVIEPGITLEDLDYIYVVKK